MKQIHEFFVGFWNFLSSQHLSEFLVTLERIQLLKKLFNFFRFFKFFELLARYERHYWPANWFKVIKFDFRKHQAFKTPIDFLFFFFLLFRVVST